MNTFALTKMYGRIDRAINDLIEIDLACSKLTNRSVGFQNLKSLKQELRNNAYAAVTRDNKEAVS
jgi:hypothetical protein